VDEWYVLFYGVLCHSSWLTQATEQGVSEGVAFAEAERLSRELVRNVARREDLRNPYFVVHRDELALFGIEPPN
jgi:hypothetical protein